MSRRGPVLSELLTDEGGQLRRRAALVTDSGTVTYGELEQRSLRLASGLSAAGIAAGDAVAVWMTNRSGFVELQFALARIGAVMVCVNTRYRSRELAGVLTQSRARWLVTEPNFRRVDFLAILGEVAQDVREQLSAVILDSGEQVPRNIHGVRAIGLHELRSHAPTLSPAKIGKMSDQPCVAFASSGSTGMPKLILHSQRGIVDHARAVAASFFPQEDAVALVALPLGGVFGYVTLMGMLAAGRPSVLTPAFNASEAVELIARHRVTHVMGPDEIIQRTLVAAAEAPEKIASWCEGGFGYQSVDSDDLVAFGDRVGVVLYGCYGSSECLGLMSHQPRAGSPAVRAQAGGIPASPALQIRVRSADGGEIAPDDAPGLLEIRGPSVMLGYLHQPEATDAAFTRDGWFKTGDIGYRVAESDRFVFLTRANDVLRLAGFLVEPREIEGFIEELKGVESAQVVQVATAEGPRAVAFVIPAAGGEVSEDQVIAYCRAALANYKVPQRVFMVDAFPRTASPNGEKVQRGRLRDLAHELLGQQTVEARS